LAHVEEEENKKVLWKDWEESSERQGSCPVRRKKNGTLLAIEKQYSARDTSEGDGLPKESLTLRTKDRRKKITQFNIKED